MKINFGDMWKVEIQPWRLGFIKGWNSTLETQIYDRERPIRGWNSTLGLRYVDVEIGIQMYEG